MSLATPDKIRTLQKKLYRKAKAEPAFRFYLLYDKIHREDILRHAYAMARRNAGGPGGVGGPSRGPRFEAVPTGAGAAGDDPEGGGGDRPLGIPTIRDRVVQAAAKLV